MFRHMAVVDSPCPVLRQSFQVLPTQSHIEVFMARPRPTARRVLAACLFGLLLAAIAPSANDTAQAVPFGQDWSNPELITTSDDWTSVPGIVGYRGDGLAAATGVDPQTVLAEG